ncbi:Putative esterase [Microbulbifer donghaiensis]|uniref:Putative esterase n=1 Tax=Microbulbifer donghaiensis TaxID=494016 RepID=A0A1M4VEB8_9GAMM|nr:alpha/beta hydrolase-fold protein [Microbulbifer donghaiensis]SHE67265.1 Putative esterase [Microbulbifer donghaiensis]
MKWILILAAVLFSSICHAATLSYADSLTIDSAALAEKREFYIKLPDSYSENPQRKYPVLYVLHGQWDTLPAVATLTLLDNEIPEFIVVGVQSRGPELRPASDEATSRQTPFARFLDKELVPHIEKHYRVAPYKILSGHSNSGRFVMNSWLDDGKDFSAYYAFSPSMEDGVINSRAKAIPNQILRKRAPLAVTIASEGDHMQVPFTELAKELLPPSLGNTTFKRFPEQTHSTSRHASLMFALQTTFSGWTPSYQVKVGGFAGLKQHYTELNERFGFYTEIPLETLQRLSAHHGMSDAEDADENLALIIEYGIEQKADNAEAFIEVVDYMNNNDLKAGGARVLKNVCRVVPSNKACQLASKSAR